MAWEDLTPAQAAAVPGVPLGALLAGALGTALGVRDGLWVLQGLFAAAGLILFSSRIRTGLPGAAQAAPPRPPGSR